MNSSVFSSFISVGVFNLMPPVWLGGLDTGCPREEQLEISWKFSGKGDTPPSE
jgi:hypothetical protein